MNKHKLYKLDYEVMRFNQQYPVGTEVFVKLPDGLVGTAVITTPAQIMWGTTRCTISAKDGYLALNNVIGLAE